MAAISACAQFIREVMARKKLTQLEVGQRLGHQRNGSVRGVIKALRPLPLDAIGDWANALRLSPEEARIFRRLALRSYGPPYVQGLVDEIDALTAKIEAYERDDAQ